MAHTFDWAEFERYVLPREHEPPAPQTIAVPRDMADTVSTELQRHGYTVTQWSEMRNRDEVRITFRPGGPFAGTAVFQPAGTVAGTARATDAPRGLETISVTPKPDYWELRHAYIRDGGGIEALERMLAEVKNLSDEDYDRVRSEPDLPSPHVDSWKLSLEDYLRKTAALPAPRHPAQSLAHALLPPVLVFMAVLAILLIVTAVMYP